MQIIDSVCDEVLLAYENMYPLDPWTWPNSAVLQLGAHPLYSTCGRPTPSEMCSALISPVTGRMPTLLCLKIYFFDGVLFQEGRYFLCECLSLCGIVECGHSDPTENWGAGAETELIVALRKCGNQLRVFSGALPATEGQPWTLKAFPKNLSVMQHCGPGQQASGLNTLSGETMREFWGKIWGNFSRHQPPLKLSSRLHDSLFFLNSCDLGE